MKQILAILTVAILSITTVYAQKDRYTVNSGHDIRFGIGYKNIEYNNSYDVFNPNFDSNDYLTYQGARYFTGTYTVGYTYQFLKWIAVGGNLSYSGKFNNIMNLFDDTKIGKVKENHFNIAPTIRFSWLNRDYAQMYSKISLGLSIETRTTIKNDVKISYSNINTSGQITFLGISIGRKVFGFIEAGFGTQGVLIFGVGYKFNKVII